MKMNEIAVSTTSHTQFVNIDRKVEEAIAEAGIKDGICHVFVPHTTAGLTINENADPDVVADIIQALERAVPWNASYAHGEGNAAAHVKARMMRFSQTVPIHGGRLAFGTWQSLYFCEFDGPRTRKVWVQCIPQLALPRFAIPAKRGIRKSPSRKFPRDTTINGLNWLRSSAAKSRIPTPSNMS